MNINKLYQIIIDHKRKKPKNSYTTSLFSAGKARIIDKVKEEANEVIYAAKKETKKRVISEVADLWFHLLVMLAEIGIQPKEIIYELERRNKK